MINYKCYNCNSPLPEGEPQTWFCDEKCKNKYWEKENVKTAKPKTITQIQAALAKWGKKVEASDVLAKIAEDETYFTAREIFGPPKKKVQGFDD